MFKMFTDNLSPVLDNLNPLKWLMPNFGMSYIVDPTDPPADPPADPPPADPPADPPPADPPKDPPPEGSWRDSLEDDVKNHPGLEKYKSVSDQVRSHLELEKKIGLKGLLVPGKDAPQKDVDKFQIELGRPEAKEGYEIPKLPEGTDDRIQVSEQTEVLWKDFAFKNGISQDLSKSLQAFDLERQKNALIQMDAADKEDKEKAETALRGEWGDKYEENKASAIALVKKLGSDEAMDELIGELGNRPANKPAVLKFLANMASKFGEDKLGEGGDSSLTLTPAQAAAEIQKIRMDLKDPYHDENSPLRKERVNYMESLYKMAYPPKKEATV